MGYEDYDGCKRNKGQVFQPVCCREGPARVREVVKGRVVVHHWEGDGEVFFLHS